MAVLVLDKQKRPLMPCTPKRARKRLECGGARMQRRFPFCIWLAGRFIEQSASEAPRRSLDPGSKTTGLAISRVDQGVDADGAVDAVRHIAFLVELVHRGVAIKEALHARSAMRRCRHLRNRAARFSNRSKPRLAPSLRHRIDPSVEWVAQLCHLAQELARFDLQKMANPEISGVAYQQGTLPAYEVREYLLEKFNRTCADCDVRNLPLQAGHVDATAKGGSNRIRNLTPACKPCNTNKAARGIKESLATGPVRLARVLGQAKAPLRDAVAVNTTRRALFNSSKETGLPAAAGTGGQTKRNRRLGILKTHALDAACVGSVFDLRGTNVPAVRIKCTGRSSRCKTRLNKYGFPSACLTTKKSAYAFRTGDRVEANVHSGKNQGVHEGRLAIRMTGNFNIQTGLEGAATVPGISYKHRHLVQCADGHGYVWKKTHIRQPNANPKANAILNTAIKPRSKATTAARQHPFLTARNDGVSRSKI